MKRALSLLLAGALSLSLLAGCSAAEQLSAEPISLTAQELSAHDLDTKAAYDALLRLRFEAAAKHGADRREHPSLPALRDPGPVHGGQRGGGRDAGPVSGALGGVSLEALNAACQSLLSDYRQLGGSTGPALPTACGWTRRGRSLRRLLAAA